MRRTLALSTALLIAALAAAHSEQSGGTPDRDLGLARGSVFDVPAPDAVAPETSDPGEKPLLARDYEGSPPRVPHNVADFLPITREENLCADCHGIQEAEPGDPTPLPASHYTDYRNSPERAGENLVGARYVCVTCHVAPTLTRPLVGSRFSATPAQQSEQNR